MKVKVKAPTLLITNEKCFMDNNLEDINKKNKIIIPKNKIWRIMLVYHYNLRHTI